MTANRIETAEKIKRLLIESSPMIEGYTGRSARPVRRFAAGRSTGYLWKTTLYTCMRWACKYRRAIRGGRSKGLVNGWDHGVAIDRAGCDRSNVPGFFVNRFSRP